MKTLFFSITVMLALLISPAFAQQTNDHHTRSFSSNDQGDLLTLQQLRNGINPDNNGNALVVNPNSYIMQKDHSKALPLKTLNTSGSGQNMIFEGKRNVIKK